MKILLFRRAPAEALKSGPLANAPGLYFDAMSHRWQRADKTSKAGVHFDPKTRRARAVAKDDASAPDWMREMNAEAHERHQKTAQAMNGVLDHFERGTLEFHDPRTQDRHAVVIPDASEPGRWRFSEYDSRGFGGHRTFDTPHEAATAAAAEGYTAPAAGSLDRLAATDTWAKGTRDAKIGQVSNELGFAGHADARRAVDDHYAKHGFTQEAHDRIMQPHVLEALRRGDVPEALKAIGEYVRTMFGPEVLKDAGQGHKAPKLGFGEASAAGDRWLTITPPGADHGHPVLIHTDPHNPRIGHVVGGAGGKLNYLKIHLKSPEEYRKQAAERAKQKRAQAAEARAAGKGADGDSDAVKTRTKAIKEREDDLTKQHGEAYERVAKALGWTDIEPPPEALTGLDEAAQAKVRKDHAAQLKKDVHAAVGRARMLLVESTEARTQAGVTEFSAKSSPDRPAVEDLVGMDSLRRGLGYAPERAELDDPEIHAEKVRVIEGRFRDEKAAGNAEGAAVLAQRLASHRPISADEIDQAGPEALAGYARAAVARLETLREHAAVVGEDAPPPATMDALEALETDASSIADALDNAAAPSSAAAMRDALKQAAEAGLLDPKAHRQREAALEGARFEAVGAPLPDELAPEAVDDLDEKQVDVLVAEAAKRARQTAAAPEDLRRDAARVPPAGDAKKKGGDPADKKTLDIEDEIEKKRQADNLGEDGVAVGSMDAETKRDFLRRALDAGIIGADPSKKAEAKPKAPKRNIDVKDADTAARLLLADRSIKDLHKQRRDLRAAKESGRAIDGIDNDSAPAWKSQKDGVLDLKYDAAQTSPEVVAQVESDLRTMRARSFLSAVHETNDAFAETSGFRPDETHAELARHVSFGAADALNEHAQTILGQPAIDRQVIDTLGAAAAAQIVAWAAHQERPDDVESIAEAVGEHHAKTQMQVAEEATQAGVEHAAKAAEIHQHLQTASGDLRTLSALSAQRVKHYDEARKGMGRALGALEATAALHEAMARGKPPTEVRASMGTQDALSVAKSARALGLEPEDFEVQTEGTNSWLKIKASGFPKLRKPSDPDGARLDADMLAIKRGDRDEHGWLPAGLTRRADPGKVDVPPPKMHSEPFDYGLQKHGSIEEAMKTYVAQRAHDGLSPEAIHDDLMHGGHQDALKKAHTQAEAPAEAAPAGEHDAKIAEWERRNPEPEAETPSLFGGMEANPAHTDWKADRAVHVATQTGAMQAWDRANPEPETDDGEPTDEHKEWQRDRKRHALAAAKEYDAQKAAKPKAAEPTTPRMGADQAAQQWGAAMDAILPSRRHDPEEARKATEDAAALAAAGADPAHPDVAKLMKKHKAATVEDLRATLDRKSQGAQGRQTAQHLHDEVQKVAKAHAAEHGITDNTIHGQSLDPVHGPDAVFRALAAHPAAVAAFKPPHRINDDEKRALRDAFLRYHGVKDEDIAARKAGLEKVRAWDAANPEPAKTEFNPLLQEHSVTQEWQGWNNARRNVTKQHGVSDEEDNGITWEDYVHAHRGPAAAYRAAQDLVKSRFLADVKAHHERLTGKAMKAGATPIEGWREHNLAVNPEWRKAVAQDRGAAANVAREKNRAAGGQYGRGSITEETERNLEVKAAEHQQNVTLSTGEPPPVPTGNAAAKPHERVTLGPEVEKQAAAHVAEFAPMIDPSKTFAARASLRMDGDKVNQQRAVKAWTRAGKLGLFLGAGSGKTNVSFGAFGELRKAGRAERGLFAVPSNVQGQFGTEALAFTEPGGARWWAKPGAPKSERMAAYKDPGAHMVVVTHQALRDDVTDMVAEHLGMDRKQVVEGMTGFDAEGNKAQGWSREQMDQHIGDALKKAGAEKLLDFMAVDEGHTALNRAGKQDSHLARVVDSLGRISKHAGFMTGSPVKNDACLHPNTPITDAADGVTMSVKEWADRGLAPRVWALNEATGTPEIVKASVPWVKSTSRPMFRVMVGDDLVTVAADHKFLTPQGWRHLSDLQPGDLAAVVPVDARPLLSSEREPLLHSQPQRALDALRGGAEATATSAHETPATSGAETSRPLTASDGSRPTPSSPDATQRSSLSSLLCVAHAHAAPALPTSDGAPLQTAPGPSAAWTCDHRSTETTPGSRPRCCECRGLDDGRLHSAEETDRGGPPSRAGAQPPCPACRREDVPGDAPVCIRPTDAGRLPTEGVSRLPSAQGAAPSSGSMGCLLEGKTLESRQGLSSGHGRTRTEESPPPPATLESAPPTGQIDFPFSTSFVEFREVRIVSKEPNADIYDLTVPVHHNYMTCGIWHHNTEVYDWLAKVAHTKYHDGPDGITRAAFLRRYGSDMPATKAALARELSRYTIMGSVSPGTDPNIHTHELPPTETQAKRLGEIDDAYQRARRAGRSSAVDIEAMKTLAPHRFDGRPDEEHHEIAQSMSRPITLAGVRDAAYDRAIHLDENGAKLAKLRELAAGYKAQAYPRQETESEDEHKARVARGDTTRRAGVVFARQLDAIPKIKAALEKDGHEVVDVTGTMSSEEKQKRLDAYKAGKGTILLASDAIEAGSNLQRASWLAHYNIPQTFKGWDQRSARINRIGQKFTDLDIHTLTLDHESEHRRMATLERKEALDDALKSGAAGMLDDSGLSREIREQIARRQADGARAAG